MLLCRRSSGDRLIQQLVNEYGINMIIPARADISAGDLLISEANGSARIAAFKQVLGVQPVVTLVNGGAPTAENLILSDEVDIGLAAKIAGAFLSVLDLPAAKLSGALKRHGESNVHLRPIAPSCISIENVDEVLEQIRSGSNGARDPYVDRRLFLVTRAYSAKGLEFIVQRKSKNQGNISTGIAQELQLGSSLKVLTDREGSYSFKAESTLVFGVTVQELYFESGILQDRASAMRLVIKGKSSGNANIMYDFISENVFVNLCDDRT